MAGSYERSVSLCKQNCYAKMKKKFYAPGELADLYGVSLKTFNAWLKPFAAEIGKRPRTYYYNAKQVQVIFDKLGNPYED